MSTFTTQVRFICEQMYGLDESAGLSKINDIVHATSGEIIGEYPIFDESYRNVLNDKIIKHYYTREIGEETVGLWRFRLNTKMNEIMPYFNKLYESELLKFNPFYDVELSTSKSGSGEQVGESEEKKNKDYSDTKNESGERNVSDSNTKTTSGETVGQESDSRVSESENVGSTSGESGVSRSGTNADKSKGASTSNVTDSNSKSQLDKYADTPQGSVSGLLDGNYLTNARDITEEENKEKSANDSTTAESEREYEESETVSNSQDSKNSLSGSESGVRDSKVSESGSETDERTISGKDEKSMVGSGVSNEKNSASSKLSSTENYVETVMGKRGNVSYSKMLQEFRDTFINIDMLVIEELSTLFIGLWE